jgi:hypothetical protein
MSKVKLVDISPFQKDIQKYLCDGYSPKEISKWIKTQTDNEDEHISEYALRDYKKEYCPHVKWNRKKLVVEENPEPKPKPKPKSNKETVQTEYVVKEDHDATPEETVQKLLNIIFYNCHTFKDGNVVQALSAVARLINDKEIEKIDVEDTMRRFVTTEKLKDKVQNAKYD